MARESSTFYRRLADMISTKQFFYQPSFTKIVNRTFACRVLRTCMQLLPQQLCMQLLRFCIQSIAKKNLRHLFYTA